jgi:hypothetical protein
VEVGEWATAASVKHVRPTLGATVPTRYASTHRDALCTSEMDMEDLKPMDVTKPS